MATPPITPKKIRPLFEEYLEVLDQTGLRPLFEPVERRVTLSTHANAFKPDRAMFETALRRLRVRATLDECLLITENTAHIKAARTGDTPGLQAGHELGSRTRVKQRGSRIRLPLRGNRRLPRNTHGCLAR
jgi:FMN phosphatase YigB (HAD superfamily)